jgi:hypothetical protein
MASAVSLRGDYSAAELRGLSYATEGLRSSVVSSPGSYLVTRRPKRPRDPAQLAKLIVDIATGEVEEAQPDDQARRRAGGLKGGEARAV